METLKKIEISDRKDKSENNGIITQHSDNWSINLCLESHDSRIFCDSQFVLYDSSFIDVDPRNGNFARLIFHRFSDVILHGTFIFFFLVRYFLGGISYWIFVVSFRK